MFGKSKLHVEIWFEPQSSLFETSAEILINISYRTKLSWYGKMQIIHFSLEENIYFDASFKLSLMFPQRPTV